MGARFVSIRKKNMLCTKIYQILHRKRISMLAGLTMSFSECKCAFYRPEHKAINGTSWNWILKFLKCKTEIYQVIELKEWVHMSRCKEPSIWNRWKDTLKSVNSFKNQVRNWKPSKYAFLIGKNKLKFKFFEFSN